MLYYSVLFVHIVVSLILILVVLLQSGKAGDLASAFGGATSQTAFGARSATTMLSKLTTFCAIVFMLTSLTLSIMYSRQTGTTIMQGAGGNVPAARQETTTPATQTQTPPAEPPAETKPSGQEGAEPSNPGRN